MVRNGALISNVAGYPLKFHFQILCVFPVRPQILPVPIYVICDYYIHKTDSADLSNSKNKLKTNFPVFSLCFDKISKFPVFSLTGILFPRVAKCACPRVLDDQKMSEDNQKLRSGCPPDYQIVLEKYFENNCQYKFLKDFILPFPFPTNIYNFGNLKQIAYYMVLK